MVEDIEALLRGATASDSATLARLFAAHESRLLRLVDLRMDPRLRARVDAGDVLQEAWIEIERRFGEFLADRSMPFHLWLRFLVLQTLAATRRRHLEAKARDAGREAVKDRRDATESIESLCHALVETGTSPTRAVQRAETKLRVEQALAGLDEQDREIVLLRVFESLSNEDAARVLQIEAPAASKRFVRALQRLRHALDGLGLSIDAPRQ